MNKLLISYSGPTLICIPIDKVTNVHKNIYYNNFMFIEQIETKQKKWINEFQILHMTLYTFFTGKLLVMTFAIINSVLICSINTLWFLMWSLVLRYLISIYLLILLLIILIKENYSRIVAKYLYGLIVKLTIFGLELYHFCTKF